MNLNSGDKLGEVKKFNKCLIDAALKNLTTFQYEGKEYIVGTYGEFVQTLINDRILYRIYINDKDNKDHIIENLMDYLN